jgi:hypothetical protein
MFRLPPDPGNPDAQAKGLAPQRASAAPSRGAGSFSGPSLLFRAHPCHPEGLVDAPEADMSARAVNDGDGWKTVT